MISGFVVVILSLVVAGLFPAFYLMWRKAKYHYVLCIVITGIVLTLVYYLSFWFFEVRDYSYYILVLSPVLMAFAAIYVGLVAIEDIVSLIKEHGEAKGQKAYNKTLEVVNNDRGTARYPSVSGTTK